ncbi:malto-oligosyltrehalose synthase [Chloroflexota bacterium]
MLEPRIPVATYRLQFNNQFRFEDASDLVPYLYKLGISDLYASPVFKARQGSSHGYDITDPTLLNPELGTETDFEALAGKLREHNMGLLLDIVPNHLAASQENLWWQDVLNKGKESPYAAFFDLDWLAFEKTGNATTGYRRFFDIGDLVGVRVENPAVFEVTHSLILRLIAEGKITGLRVDHIDGLNDPFQYLSRLQQSIISDKKDASASHGFYIVVEKILSGDEILPEEWPVFGTTGYDFANMLNIFFVDSKGVQALGEVYSRFTGSQTAFNDVVYQKKRQVMEELFPGELSTLGNYLSRLAQEVNPVPSLSPEEAKEAICEITACLPVYRTYIRAREVSPRDQEYLERALQEAMQRSQIPDTAALDFLRRVLLLDLPDTLSQEQGDHWQNFVMRWQQLTGAIMAKGFEDTALYTYNRLISLNEVGGNPSKQGLPINEFHKHNIRQLKHWPHTLNTTSTHDTKRSEDVRAKINVLSEIPGEWQKRLAQWRQFNQPEKRMVKGQAVPEPNMEIFLYQTLIGTWPLFLEEVPEFKQRLKAYMIKAVREAKVYSSWLSPNSEYENAFIQFVESILDSSKQNDFLEDFLLFEKQTAFYGALNSLAQLLLKITLPGVPDFYQGTELWDFSLVDPDNRRPVDFARRTELLDDLIRQETYGQQSLVQQLLNSWEDGRLKLYMSYKALGFRKSLKDVFQNGGYIPLQVAGQKQEHVCAFGRQKEGKWTLTVVPRLFTRLSGLGVFPSGLEVWQNTVLLLLENAPRHWLNVLTGESLIISGRRAGLRLSDVFHIFPLALLKNT